MITAFCTISTVEKYIGKIVSVDRLNTFKVIKIGWKYILFCIVYYYNDELWLSNFEILTDVSAHVRDSYWNHTHIYPIINILVYGENI